MNLRHLLHRDEGAVAVELALVSPLMLLLLFGIYDFGMLSVNFMEVRHATQVAGQYAHKAYIVNGSVTLSNIQSAATAATPLTVTISVDPRRPALIWCGTPASDGNSVLTDSGKSPPCPSGDLPFLTIVGTAPSQSTLGSWSGFPSTLAWPQMVSLK